MTLTYYITGNGEWWGEPISERVLRLNSRETVYRHGKIIPRNKSDTGIGENSGGKGVTKH